MQNEISDATPGSQAGLGEARGATGADTLPWLYVVRGEPTEAELAAVVSPGPGAWRRSALPR
jgi:hypothetical protein